jgi:hypothetical protein
VFETTNPSRDIWGDFNGRMANTFLINLNELSKKETLEAEGKIKGLVTDPILTINNKGSNQFDIQSYHRFIISTNNEEPINTNKDDRRKFIIRCSDELIGNKEYFNTLYEHLNNVDCVKTCYEYFKSIADMDQFNKIPVPITEYHQNLMEFSMSPIEQWVRDYTFINQNRDFEELKSETILEKFNDWKENNGVKYECSSIQLAVRISRLKINGIEKSRSKESRKTRFTFELMKKHFGM